MGIWNKPIINTEIDMATFFIIKLSYIFFQKALIPHQKREVILIHVSVATRITYAKTTVKAF